MKIRKYYRLHIPGNCKCELQKLWSEAGYTTEEMSLLEFFKELNRWNWQGQGHWQYWSMESK